MRGFFAPQDKYGDSSPFATLRVRMTTIRGRLLNDSLKALAAEEDGLDEAEVGLGIDADGVEVGGLDIDGEAVLEEAELFEALGALEPASGQGGEAVEGGFAISVEADVLPVLRLDPGLRSETWLDPGQ